MYFPDYLFAPTDGAADNLRKEGYSQSSIFVTGNTGIDALLLAADIVRTQGHALPMNLPAGSKLAPAYGASKRVVWRRTGSICQAVLQLLSQHPNLHILYPVHPNPNVQEAAQSIGRTSTYFPCAHRSNIRVSSLHLLPRI